MRITLKQNRLGGPFYVRIYNGRRTPKDKTVPTGTCDRKVAERHRARIERDVADGTFDPWAPVERSVRPETLLDAARAFLADRSAYARPSTLKAYDDALRGLLRTLPPRIRVDAVQPFQVRPYVAAADVSAETQHHRLRHLRVFFRWCVKEGLAKEIPTDGVRLRKVGRREPVSITPDEARQLLAHLDAPRTLWLRDVVIVALCTGLRRGELCALRWEGIDLTPVRETLRLRSGEHGFASKNDNDVVRPLLGDAVAVIARRRAAEPAARPGDPVFVRDRGHPLLPDHLTHAFKQAARAAGLPERVKLHSLRHSCATWLMQAGVPLPMITRLLDHSSIAVTQRYLHASQDDLRTFAQTAFASDTLRLDRPAER